MFTAFSARCPSPGRQRSPRQLHTFCRARCGSPLPPRRYADGAATVAGRRHHRGAILLGWRLGPTSQESALEFLLVSRSIRLGSSRKSSLVREPCSRRSRVLPARLPPLVYLIRSTFAAAAGAVALGAITALILTRGLRTARVRAGANGS